MKQCPNCNAEMTEADFICQKCGWIKRYINSKTKMGMFLNSTVIYYKQAGFFSTAFYLVACLLNSVFTFPYKFKEWLQITRMIKARKQMEPPWLAFPDIPSVSIGWRMGGGESFLMTWDRWYKRISEEERIEYQRSYPEPPSWDGFYKSRER